MRNWLLALFFLPQVALGAGGVTNGQPVNATVTNNAFLFKNGDDIDTFKLSFNRGGTSGPTLTDIQLNVNSLFSYLGVTPNTTYNALPTWASNNTGLSSNSIFQRVEALDLAFAGAGFVYGSATIFSAGELTGDVTTSGSRATTISAGAVTNSKLNTMAAHTYKGNNTGSTATPIDVTNTQLTADLNAFVGDSGSGGTKGEVPAPGAGDAAAGKYLKADGTWTAPAGGGGTALFWVESNVANGNPIPVINSQGDQTYQFTAGITQNLFALLKVPSAYGSGNPIKAKFDFLSADTSGNVLMQCVATLIRQGTDLISSTTNQRTSTNAAVTVSGGTVNIPQGVTCDLTSGAGTINSVAVSAGDYIRIQMLRGTDTATGVVNVPVYGAEVTIQ